MRGRLTAVVMGLLLIGVGSQPAWACSCATPPSPCELIGSSETVFIGTPVSRETYTERRPAVTLQGRAIMSEDRMIRYTFQVHEVINGTITAERSVIVSTPDGGAACEFPFQTGRRYMVHAFGTSDHLSTSICSRTALEQQSRAVLDLFTQTKRGTVVNELRGTVVRLQLAVNGWFARQSPVAPVVGARVTATDQAGRVSRTASNGDGTFLFKGIPPGTYTLAAEYPKGLRPAFSVPTVVKMDRCFAEKPLFAYSEGITGRVLGADGAAVKGRQVELTVARVDDAGSTPARDRSTPTFSSEKSGGFDIHGLPPGRYLVGVNVLSPPTVRNPYPPMWYPGTADLKRATVLAVDGVTPITIDVKLPSALATVQYSGRVVDAAGRPVTRARVVLRSVGSDPVRDVDSEGEPDAQGRFSLAGLPDRAYEVEAVSFTQGVELRSSRVPITQNAAVTVKLGSPSAQR